MSAEELGFREIDTEEALAQAGLTFVEYGPGEAVPWEAGLYLLDVETGEVEGWIIRYRKGMPLKRPTADGSRWGP